MTVFRNFKSQSQRQEFFRTYLGILKKQSQRQKFQKTNHGVRNFNKHAEILQGKSSAVEKVEEYERDEQKTTESCFDSIESR